MQKFYTLLFLIFLAGNGISQSYIFQTFKNGKIINSESTETLKTYELDFLVIHRFGDFLGDQGGWPTFYGMENAADILIGFNYGLNDNFQVGISRTKGGNGAGLAQNVNATFKYRVMRQKTEGSPFSMAISGVASTSTATQSDNPASLRNFTKFSHRVVYFSQLMIARKFSSRFSLQLAGGYTHRNKAYANESNGILNTSLGARIQLTKVWGMLVDVVVPFASHIQLFETHQPSIGVGFEAETGGGHVFQFNFTNARGIMETDIIPYTTDQWSLGQYRLGFTISRKFKL